MASIFTRIINRDIPGYIVAEDERYIAFLDINPLVLGHTLVVPKKEVDYIFDMDDESYFGLTLFAKIVANGLKEAFPCKKVGVAVIGLEVPHVQNGLAPELGDVAAANAIRVLPRLECAKCVSCMRARSLHEREQGVERVHLHVRARCAASSRRAPLPRRPWNDRQITIRRPCDGARRNWK